MFAYFNKIFSLIQKLILRLFGNISCRLISLLMIIFLIVWLLSQFDLAQFFYYFLHLLFLLFCMVSFRFIFLFIRTFNTIAWGCFYDRVTFFFFGYSLSFLGFYLLFSTFAHILYDFLKLNNYFILFISTENLNLILQEKIELNVIFVIVASHCYTFRIWTEGLLFWQRY